MKILDLPIPRSMAKAVPELYIKNRNLCESSEGIQTLVLGHSQGDHGFDPEYFSRSFNLCSRSQDAKMSYYLYEKMGLYLPNLKRIVLFYSMISPGFLTEREKAERMVAVAFNAIYKLSMPFEDDYLNSLSMEVSALFDGVDWGYESDGFTASNGYVKNPNIDYFENLYWQRRRLPQLHGYNELSDATEYLDKMMLLAKERGHSVYFVVAPNRSDFLASTPGTSDYLHRHLLDALVKFELSKSAVYTDLYNSQDFSDSDFGDFVHLIPGGAGARRVTKSIHAMVERNEGVPL